MKRATVINAKDNVATALDDLEAGDTVTITSAYGAAAQEITATKAIPFGHKMARQKIAQGVEVIKYGEVIGVATQDIEQGEHVHVYNVNSARFGTTEKGGK